MMDSKIELLNSSRKIKKFCKKNECHPILQKMYLNIQRELLKKVNNDISNYTDCKKTHYHYSILILGRVYEINKEFLSAISLGHFHSANALTRHIIELYIKSLYTRYNPSYLKIISQESRDKFPQVLNIINSLKKLPLPIEISYFNFTNEFNKENFLEKIYDDFRYYSDLFHPSQKSFASNIWVLEKDKEGNISTKLHIENPKEPDEETTILFFPKKTPIEPEHIKYTIHQFFTYSSFILKEIENFKK